MGRARIGLVTFLLAGILAGMTACQTPVRVERASRSQSLFASYKENLFSPNKPSARTEQTLRKYDLDDLARLSPPETEQRLLEQYREEPIPDLLYALAELTFLRGLRSERWHQKESLPLFYRAAGYSYHYLFMTARSPEPGKDGPNSWFTPQDVFDPRFRLACELYNQSLARCIQAAMKVGQLQPSHVLKLPAPDGSTFELSVTQNGFLWKPGDFHDLQLCSDYRVHGLANHHRTYGLGVPLIVTRVGLTDHRSDLGEQVSFPATAFFRFEGTLDDLTKGRSGRLELYDPLRIQVIEVKGLRIPLESDITTPLAYCLARSELQGIGLRAFLQPRLIEDRTGIYMIEPYQPGKIPVLFVHGLISSPLTWAQMFNDLRSEPDLRERYQFWFYFYPTSAPYLASAADLRHRLSELQKRVDPHRQDAAFNRMVLVGHSMGGLVCKLQTVDSGEDFLRTAGNPDLENPDLSASARRILRESVCFEHNPSIARVVFIGTPHRGSALSLSVVGRIADHFAGMPRVLRQASAELLRVEPQVNGSYFSRRLPTSVDLLRPNSPALELLQNRPRPAETAYHSIIGVTDNHKHLLERFVGGQLGVLGDCIVPLTSAQISDVESEAIVPADHFTIQQHPLSVLEMRRILRGHLQSLEN